MSNGAVAAIIILRQIKKIILKFEKTQTTSEQTAKTLKELNLHNRFIFCRLLKRRVLVEVKSANYESAKYYLNKEILPQYFKNRRRRALRGLIIFGIVVLFIICLMYLTHFFK